MRLEGGRRAALRHGAALALVLSVGLAPAATGTTTDSVGDRHVRSVAEDPKLAQLFGINASLVYIGVFVFECAAVALGAGLVAPRSPILTSMGFDEVILTFVVVVLGGIGSVTGSLLAGFGLGMFTALFGALVSPAYTTAAAFLLLLIVLVTRPRGLAAR